MAVTAGRKKKTTKINKTKNQQLQHCFVRIHTTSCNNDNNNGCIYLQHGNTKPPGQPCYSGNLLVCDLSVGMSLAVLFLQFFSCTMGTN